MITVSIGFLLAMACLFLFWRSQSLKGKLENSEQMVNKLQQDNKQQEEEKKKLLRENEKLHVDAVSYLSINTRLESEKEQLVNNLQKADAALNTKAEELEKAQINLKKFEEKLSKESQENQVKLEKELARLKDNVKDLEQTLSRERGLYHYNLAVSYTQAQLYDQAVEAYEKSLKYDPGNPDAHYNLGLLYGNILNSPERAVQEYRTYLKLRPEAEDQDEVKAWIRELEGGL